MTQRDQVWLAITRALENDRKGYNIDSNSERDQWSSIFVSAGEWATITYQARETPPRIRIQIASRLQDQEWIREIRAKLAHISCEIEPHGYVEK